MDVPHFDDVLACALWMCRLCLTLTPKSLKTVGMPLLLPDEEVPPSLPSNLISFAPGLLDAAQPAKPSTLEFSKGLRNEIRRSWAVYLLVFVKPGRTPRIYFGSGTKSALVDVTHRLQGYDIGHPLPPKMASRLHTKASYAGWKSRSLSSKCLTELP